MRKNIIIPKRMDEFLAEEIGWHLGDGSMNFYNQRGFYQLRGHIDDDKQHYKTRIKPIYKKLFNLDVSLREMPTTRVYGFQIWSDELVEYKRRLGLPLGKKLNFIMPRLIKENLIFAKSFVRGFFDTDGCLYLENKNGKLYPRVEMASISGAFMQDLSEVLSIMGFNHSSYIEKRSKYGWKDLHRVIIRGHPATKKWFNEIIPQNPKHVSKWSIVKEMTPP